jgi:hypothetical protein
VPVAPASEVAGGHTLPCKKLQERSVLRKPSIGWSEASDANDTAKIRPSKVSSKRFSKNTKNRLFRALFMQKTTAI